MFSPMLLPLTPQSVSPMAIDSHGTHVGGDNETEPADTISTPVAANQLFDRYFEQFEQTQTALARPLPGIIPAGRPQVDADTDDYYEDFAPQVDRHVLDL